jgi:hypothetical protein
VAHLQEQRTVAKAVATFDTFRAADAKLFVDRVFVIGILDEAPLNGRGRTKLIFRSGIERIWFGLEVSGAKLAVAADCVCVNAFHGGLLQDTVRRAAVTMETLGRINLPHSAFRLAAAAENADEAT